MRSDYRKAFDSIKQEKLFEIVTHLFTKDDYFVHSYRQTYLEKKQLRTRFKHAVEVTPEWPQFYDIAAEIASHIANNILTDNVRTVEVEKDELIELIKEHIFQTVVKFGDQYYILKEARDACY